MSKPLKEVLVDWNLIALSPSNFERNHELCDALAEIRLALDAELLCKPAAIVWLGGSRDKEMQNPSLGVRNEVLDEINNYYWSRGEKMCLGLYLYPKSEFQDLTKPEM